MLGMSKEQAFRALDLAVPVSWYNPASAQLLVHYEQCFQAMHVLAMAHPMLEMQRTVKGCIAAMQQRFNLERAELIDEIFGGILPDDYQTAQD